MPITTSNDKFNSREFLAKQLESTAEIIEWTIFLFDKDRLKESPPHENHPKASAEVKTYFGQWSALRVLFHLVFYEEISVLPIMKRCLSESKVTPSEGSNDEEEEWIDGVKLTELLERFRKVRREQIAIIKATSKEEWNNNKIDYYSHGKVSISWLVAKTIQHTLDHGDKLLRKALYWDDMLNWLNEQDE